MLILVAACGGSANPEPLSSSTAATALSPVAPSPSPAASTEADWLTYHGDATRSGQTVARSPWQALNPAWQSDRLDGDIYAAPLYFHGRVIVATENDTIYALDGASGRTIWQTNLGKPVDGRGLPCGNINPSGITSTPVIDPQSGLVYAVAFLDPAHHDLVAIDANSGELRFRIAVDPPGADPRVHQQRAALALGKDLVYVAYGGLFGDCGNYSGWVVGARKDGTGSLATYKVSVGREGGIWTPAGPSIDTGGFLYVSTGNSDSTSTGDEGESVLRLSPDLKRLDSFTAADEVELNRRDIDLGSVAPVLAGPNTLFQAGKAGVGYLLRPDHLGGLGGEVFSAPVCSGGAYGGGAFTGPMIYVPCRDGLVAVRLTGDTAFTVAWRGPRFNAGPPILAGGFVWTVDINAGLLYGLVAETGDVRFKESIGAVAHFTTPSFGGGNLLVAANRQVLAFRGE